MLSSTKTQFLFISLAYTCSILGAKSKYLAAASNTMIVGHAVGKLTEYLLQTAGENVRSFCIGHSLGAHVCGFIGKTKQLDGIIGLDPAGPVFEQNSEGKRLDKRDALMVKVLHINAGELGIAKAIGDVDIYVNGGKRQPGCDPMNFVCSHNNFAIGFVNHIWKTGSKAAACTTNYFCDDEEKAMVTFPRIVLTRTYTQLHSSCVW